MLQHSEQQINKNTPEVKSNHIKTENKCSFKFGDFDSYFQKLKQFFSLIEANPELIYTNIIYQYCSKYENWDIGVSTIQKLYRHKIQNLIKWQRIKKNWGRQDLRILVWIVNKYAALHTIRHVQDMKLQDWDYISSLLPCTQGKSCMFKILSLRKVRINEHPWSQIESQTIIKLVKQYDTNDWKKIAQQLYIKLDSHKKVFRNAKQCKQHWVCYLNPSIKKGPWTQQEDEILLKEVIANKERKKWTQISKILKGRTQNSVKNRFHLLVNRENKNRNKIFDDVKLAKRALISLNKQELLQDESQVQIKVEDIEVEQDVEVQKKQQNCCLRCQNQKKSPCLKAENSQSANQIPSLNSINRGSSFSKVVPQNASSIQFDPYVLQYMPIKSDFNQPPSLQIPNFCMLFWYQPV